MFRIDYEALTDPSEQPLDRIPEDGGCCAIFRRIACVGDSLSSGEFETKIEGEKTRYTDMFEYSWGQFIARRCGSHVSNFSRGGMSAYEYCNGFAETKGFFAPELAAQAYIIALGCNDTRSTSRPMGSVGDICDEDPEKNADSFAGWYGRIVQRYREISPDAKFFFMTMLRDDRPDTQKRVAAQSQIMRDMAEHFTNSYVIDMEKYGPVNDANFRKTFFLHGHMNPWGYLFFGKLTAAYIDWIVRHNMDDFKRVGYIGTPLADSELTKRYGNGWS